MNKSILVVEDDPDYRCQLQLRLEGLGFQVRTAETARAAQVSFQTERPHLAIVDVMLEHLDDGFALCYHFKRTDESVPVILLTAVTRETGLEFDAETPEDRCWIKADMLLHKPLPFEVLARAIHQLVKGEGRE